MPKNTLSQKSRNGLSIAEFMAEALSGKNGYYRKNRDPLGASGDFITAPEISQIFGELIGLWCVDRWQKLGNPDKVTLCELGPGRGTLMQDALRAAIPIQQFGQHIDLRLLEINPDLRALQQQKLSAYAPHWIENLDQLPDQPVIFIANEFFDALPVEQIMYDPPHWRQRLVKSDANGKLHFAPGDPADWPKEYLPLSAKPGDILEYSPESHRIVRQMAQKIATHNGAALMIDYGHLQTGLGDTLQAIRNHRYADPLQNPGDADLTCHVDFAALSYFAAQSGAPAEWAGTQSEFLRALGIEMRLHQLLDKATLDQKQSLISGVRRLTDEKEMGTLFKVLILSNSYL